MEEPTGVFSDEMVDEEGDNEEDLDAAGMHIDGENGGDDDEEPMEEETE